MKKYWASGCFDWSDDSIRLSLHPSERTEKSYLHIQEIGHFKAYTTYYTERKNIASYLIIYTESGEGKITYEGKQYDLKPHTVCFIDCKNYQFYQTSKELWEFYWIHINGRQIKEYYSDFNHSNNICCETKDSTIKYLIENMINLQNYKTRNTEIITAREIVNLLTELLIERNRVKYEDVKEIPAYIFEIQSYLEKNYHSKITLDTISQKFMINKYQIAKEFKNFVGSSLIEYVIEVRINKAKDLLKYTGNNVSEIAEQIGIENVTHFINLFKKRVGITPLRFRKYWS